jgi:hypothetical protein
VLAAIADGLTVGEAAAQAGMSRQSVFDWKNADPAFETEDEATARTVLAPRRHAG